MTDKAQILIIGAGPTGLITALALRAQGVPFRIIDAASGPGQFSRATGMHARTLELYRAFGIADTVVDNGIHTTAALVRAVGGDGKPFEVANLPLSTIGVGISKYPYLLIYPQDDHEKMLTDHLENKMGVQIERSTKLLSLLEKADGIHVEIEGPNGAEQQVYKYVIGADGAHSKVRKVIEVGFSGATYSQPFFVADVHTDDPFGSKMVVTVGASSVNVRMPVKSGSQRLIGMVPKDLKKDISELVFEDVRESAETLLGAKVTQVNWFSHYNVHHRIAEHYRVGNVFLMGDSAHLHSPMGAQGMNTGLGDSINLTWKLAQVVKGQLAPEVLDTYETERRTFGIKLVNTTDKTFGTVIADTTFGWLVRRFFWPALMAVMTRVPAARSNIFKFFSQIHISYSSSSTLSEGQVGIIKAGDRLPWIDYGKGRDNFETFDGVNWQLHVYGDAPVDMQDLDWITVHKFPFVAFASKAGFKDGAAYLMRPDSYSALVMDTFDIDKLRAYVERIGLRR